MLKQVVLFETEDGSRFNTKEEAEQYQERLDRLDLIRENLDVDGGLVSAEAVLEFITNYASWKD